MPKFTNVNISRGMWIHQNPNFRTPKPLLEWIRLSFGSP